MKKVSTIIQWCFAGFFALLSLGTGSVVSSILVLIAAVLMAPIKLIRDSMKKIKIKSAVAIVLSVVLFFVAVGISPAADSSDTTGPPSVTDEVLDSSEEHSEESSTIQNETEITSEEQSSESVSSTEATTNGGSSSSSVGTGTAKPVNPSNIPAYTNKPYVAINNNQPNFSSAELTTKAYEKYSPLDSLGRCGVAIASCGKEIMPASGEERGSISSIKPSGWNQAKYNGISGGYLWNRCHLLGWQLSAENANKQNLITGTRYMNINGMLPFENMVADYIKETGNHVAYRVTPIYKGNNLVASGVQMEAYSIEDDGDGVCFNVYCYNVQPGITIDYATGKSSQNGVSGATGNTTTEKPTEKPTETKPDKSDSVYVLNTNTKKFHYPDCHSAKKIAAHNYAESNKTRDQLIAAGYSPCGNCDP